MATHYIDVYILGVPGLHAYAVAVDNGTHVAGGDDTKVKKYFWQRKKF